jgi:hypothetical protein
MKKFFRFTLATLVVAAILSLQSCDKTKYYQLTIDFSQVTLNEHGYWNGSDGSGEMFMIMLYLNNHYISDWDYWEGFAFSNNYDTQTPGWANQYSAYIPNGDTNNTFAIAHVNNLSGSNSAVINFSDESNVISAKFANSTYAYLSMLNGDEYAKKFEEGDWLKLQIVGYDINDNEVGSVDFYLADFRSPNSYIIDQWTKVNLSSLSNVMKLVFNMSSSDNDPTYGMNTPAYFCMDDFTFEYEDYIEL